MPSFADFRSRFPSLQDASDEEIIKRTSEVFKLPITEVAQSFDYDISGGKTSQRFGSAIDRYQAGLYGTAEAVTKAAGLEGTSDYLQKQRVRNEAQADISSARAKELGAIESYKDVTGVGTGIDYVTGLAIGSVPYMAEALVTGGAGRLAMTGTRAALAEGRTALAAAEAVKDVAAADKAKQAIAVAERNLSTGATAAGFAGQYPSGVGEMLSQQREQTGGQTDLPSALGYGAAYTGLGMVGVEGALTRGNLFRNTINFLDKPGGLSGAALRTGATAVSTGLKEGVSETLQEMSGQGARMAVDDKAQFFDQDAVERYKESFVGGAALGGVMGGGLGGWRRSNSILPGATQDTTKPQAPANNDVQQAFDQPQTSGTPTANVVPPPAAPITPPSTPVVSGGTTPIAQAAQQQSQADAAAQQQQQQQAQRDLTISQFGLAGDTPGVGSFFGRPIFGSAINQVADALAPIAAQLNPAEAAIMDAIVTADQKLGNKLLSFQFNADKIANSVQKGVQAVTTAATKFQIADVQTVDEAATRLNTLSKSAKGQQLEQINAIHEALTGKDTEGYIASQTSKPKGKSNAQQQPQQVSSGLGTVPVQGGAVQGDGGLTGLLQPGAVQPVGTGVVSGAANDQQTGQLPGEGIRTGPSVAAADDLGGAAQAPQDVSGAPSEETVATTPSTQNVEANAPVLGQGVQRDGAAPTGTVQTQEGLNPGRVAWEDMDGTGTSFDDLPENLQKVWERAVAEGKATGEIQETLAASAQDTSLAAKARAVLRAALDMVIQPTSRMPEDVAARKREFVAAYWGGARSDALTKVAADLGISKDQAKRWSAELPNFLTVNGQKIKAAVETVAKERGIDIADVLDGLRSIEEQHPTEEMVDEIEGTGQSTSATEEPLSSDQEDIEVDQGALNKAPEEELNTAEADAGQNDFVISSRKSASLQEQNNAVETNQAKIMRLLDMQDKINEAESIENPPAPKIVSLSEAALEKLGGDVTKLKEHDLLNLAVNAKLTENFELADQLNAELSSRIEKALEKAQKQADQKTQKGTTNAVQEPSAEKVSVSEGAAGGQAVGKGVAKVGKATRVRKAKVEKPVETKVEEVTPAVRTPKEQWDALTQQFPGMPPYDVLTKSEKETWDDFANRGFGDIGSVATVLGGADKITKAPEAVEDSERFEREMRAAASDKPSGDDVKTTGLRFVPYETALDIAKRAVAAGVPLNWVQFHSQLDLTADSANRLVAALGGTPQEAAVEETVQEQAPTTQQSRAKQPVVERYTAEELQTSLLDFVKRESLGKDVFVVDELEDLRSLPEFAAMTDEEFANFLTKEKIDSQTQAFVTENGKAYMLASNIDVGTGRGVFMHEVGVHLGLQEKLPDASFVRLVEQIKTWAKLDDGSIENQLAIAASDRVFQSRVSDPVQRRREFVAYFVEAAVNAGLNPKAYENIQSAGLREWMRSLWAAFKNALRKLRGINVDKLSARDVVDMTYGYAQLAIGAPKFQGSGKIFRKFQMKFAGTGVGQMYGHGMYFTNKPEVAASFAKGKTPQLYGADLAVTDDELMGWATPLSQQSTTVQEAMTAAAKELGVVAGQNVRGGDFYNDLSIQIYKVRTGMRQAPQTKQQVSAAYRLASEWLDTHGVKGIKYGGDNYVIFNEDNIIRINRTPGTPTGRMDKGRPEVAWGSVQQSRRVDDAVTLLPPKLRSPVRNTTTDLLYQAKKGMLASAITEDVINMASKFMKSAKTYLAAQYARQATRLNHELKIEKILQQFDKLPKNLQGTGEGSVNKYIFDSTREGKWGYIPDERMVGTTLLTVDPDMKARYDAFPAEARKLIRDVFEQGYDALEAKQNAVRDAIDREYADRLKAVQGDVELTNKLNKEKKLALSRERKLLGLDNSKPYAYLGRYGDYVVVAKSAEYSEKEKLSKSQDISKLEKERFIGWMAENRTNPAHYVVQFAETLGEANQIADQLNATGNYDFAEAFEKEVGEKEGDLFLAVSRLRNLFDKNSTELEPSQQAAVKNLLGDLYLHTVSEASARKSEFQRLNISGADKDMMRNLATRGRADAHFLAALEHNDAISDAITAMREERNRNRGEAGPYFNELLQRHANSMKYQTPGVLSSALLRMSNVWYLATNPAFYLQQILQTGVLSLPYMSGRLGYFRSARAVKKAYGDMSALVKGLGVDDHIDFNKAPADVREMLTKLVGMGKIDIGIDSDARVRAGEAGVAAKVMQKLQGVNNRIEAINRATAAIAAYRGYLDRYKNGDTAAATAYAADVVSNTHGSYDAFNTPRIMQTGAGKVLLQFKRFQIIQISMLLKLINTAFKGASRDEKAVARRALGFIAGHMMVLGGALAVPFVTQFGSLLLKAFGDDDEPENLELTLRRLINDPVMADLLINGVPGALGVNLGGKLGMGNVFSILPFTDVDFTSRAGAEKMLVSIMGPSAGLGLKFADGLGQMAGGEYYKGLESMLPSGVANVMKAGRFATEGITMRNGDVVLKPEEISMFDAAFQAVGLPTTTITDRQFTQRVVAEFDKFYDKRTTEIKGDYVEASRKGDVNGMADAREEWSKLQESRAKNGYKRQPLSDLFRAPSAAAKRERNIAGGVEFSKSNRQFVESLSTL